MKRIVSTLALAMGLGLLSSGPALAQSKAKGPTTQVKAPACRDVQIQLMVVHAQEGETFVDPKLTMIEKHLSFLNYDSYRVKGTNRSNLSKGESARFDVEGGRQVEITLVECNPDKVKLKIEMFKADKKLVDTTVSVNRGSTFIVAGPKYQDGILLLPITATY